MVGTNLSVTVLTYSGRSTSNHFGMVQSGGNNHTMSTTRFVHASEDRGFSSRYRSPQLSARDYHGPRRCRSAKAAAKTLWI